MNRLMLALLLFAVMGGILHYKKQAAQGPQAPLVVDANGQAVVELYATSWCGYCQAMREHFTANGIRFTEYDIEKDADAAQRHADLGGRGVPLTHIGKQVVVFGYAPGDVDAALGR